MDITVIVAAIDEEIERLQKSRSLLTGHIMPMKRGMPPTSWTRRTMSTETRKKMAEAHRKRWAELKRER